MTKTPGWLLALVLLTMPTGAGAQGPRGAADLPPSAIADSQQLLATLHERVRANSRDAASWYRIGMVSWALADRARAANPPRDLDATRLTRMADSALRIAADAAPTNAHYRLMSGKLLLASQSPTTRTAANKQFGIALEVVRRSGDSITHGEVAVEAGRVFWRRFDSFKDRRVQTGAVDMERSLSDALHPTAKAEGELIQMAQNALSAGVGDLDRGANEAMFQSPSSRSMKDVEMLLKSTTMALSSSLNGAADYEQASTLFFEAYAFAPTNARAFRSVAMLLADSARWRELEQFSRTHTAKMPWDPNAWLALGLARQRQRNTAGAAVAFDSALQALAPAERARFDDIQRVLRRADSARLASVTAASRAATADVYWRYADPLWSRDGNENRTEFLARVTFAELRWTVDELGLRGADTDRGETYIRYGPPDVSATIQPKATSEGADIITFWIYKSGLMFTFSGMSTYGSARTPLFDRGGAETLKEMQPVRWDNIANDRIDSMPAQIARFRGGRDSVDVLVATLPPFDSITAESDVKESVRSEFWLAQGASVTAAHASSEIRAPGVQSWIRRVAPGAYVYRAEASAATSRRAARTSAVVHADVDPSTGFSTRGFGISDVLFAGSTTLAGSAARWTDLGATPLVGAVASNGELTLVWENYAFAEREGTSRYTVTVTLTRERSAAGRITARVLGALASVAKIDTQGDRALIQFDRTVPYSAAFADHIQIGLGGSPAGTYTVVTEVADLVSGQKATRTARLSIKP